MQGMRLRKQIIHVINSPFLSKNRDVSFFPCVHILTLIFIGWRIHLLIMRSWRILAFWHRNLIICERRTQYLFLLVQDTLLVLSLSGRSLVRGGFLRGGGGGYKFSHSL
ncbi:hypothetical protein PM082_023334 [Marasmius tenuissimus]|nr:hypothetical protein PM082_023334 [Marasmius tenuissimus]